MGIGALAQLTLSMFLFGYTLVVAVRFMLHYRVVRADGKKRAVLPLHIWVVAISYDMFVVGAAIQTSVFNRWWHAPLYITAALLGVYAMWVLSHSQRRPSDGDPLGQS